MSRELIERLRNKSGAWINGLYDDEAATALEQQAAEIERLRALHAETSRLMQEEIANAEALRKDAQRYRWLRDTPWPREVERAVMLHANASWDAAIDAAMSTQAERPD